MKAASLLKVFLLTLLACVGIAASLQTGGAVLARTARQARLTGNLATQNSDWTMFNQSQLRLNKYETRLNTSNVSKLSLAWSNKISKTATGGPLMESVVANGIFYTTSPNLYNNSLDALNEKSGKLIWQKTLSGAPMNGEYYLAVANGLVYINDGSRAEAYNATTGSRVWSKSISPEYAMDLKYGVLYIESSLGFPVGQSSLYALNPATGHTIWSVVLSQNLTSRSPAIENGVIYVGAVDGTLLALNSSTGKTLWTAFLGQNNAIVTAPVTNNGAVYVEGVSTGLFAFNATTGKQLWFAPSDPYVGSPALAHGLIYLADTYGPLKAYNENTGKLVWQSAAIVDSSYSPLVANGVVYASPRSGGVVALNAQTGKTLYLYKNNPYQGQNYSSAIVSNGMVFFELSNGYTYALTLK